MSSRLHGSGRMGGRTLGVLFAMAALAAAGETRAAATPASSDSSMTLRAGQAGTEFRSMTVEGTGDPPKEIAWDGRTKSGALVTPGLTYSYVFEAHDRAGNKRSFVGQGFTVSAYRSDTPAGPVLAMSGRDLVPSEVGGTSYGPSLRASKESSPIFLEAAGWLNQSTQVREPIRMTVGARSMDQATMLGNRAFAALSGRVIGDPARMEMVTEIAPDAPEDGVLRIGPATASATGPSKPPRK